MYGPDRVEVEIAQREPHVPEAQPAFPVGERHQVAVDALGTPDGGAGPRTS